MSGAVAAHAAYNGSGTQGLAVTNKINDDDGDVMSVFWNKNDTTRQLLYGSSIVEIPSSGASNLSYGSSRLFTVNNDIDCLGDMYLQLTASFPTYAPEGDGTKTFASVVIGKPKIVIAMSAVADSVITSDGHGFASGTPVIYNSEGGTAIATSGAALADDTVYYVIRINDDTFKLAATAVQSNPTPTPLSLTGTGNNSQTVSLPKIVIAMSAVTASVITFSGHGFASGTPVIYNSESGTALATGAAGNSSAVADDTVFYVIRINDDTFRLAATLADVSTLSGHINISGAGNNLQTLQRKIVIATSAVTGDVITSNGHGFASGTAVTYSSEGAVPALAPLVNNNVYYVIRITDDTFKLAATIVQSNSTPTPLSLTGTGNNSQTFREPTVELSVKAKPFALQSIVERVEIQVGTQVWQTLENEDIRVVNSTEMSADGFAEISALSSPTSDGTSANTAWLVIPSLTKTLGPTFGKFSNQTEDGYPMAAAPHQSVKIKVYLAEMPDTLSYLATHVSAATATVVEFAEKVPLEGTITPFGLSPAFVTAASVGLTFGTKSGGSITSCNLYAKQQIMCNEEREQMKAMPMGLPKRLKMTQNSYTSDLGSSDIKTIDLDHFSLFASHLIISGNAGAGIRLKSAELKLNSSSYSGQLPGVLLDSCTADSIGIYSNKYIYGSESFDVQEFGIGTYVFPLAATAFGGSCVPLNRFDSIRLILKFTSTPQRGASTFINVTCVGETTALFKGGAASLAMY